MNNSSASQEAFALDHAQKDALVTEEQAVGALCRVPFHHLFNHLAAKLAIRADAKSRE
jgi:nitrate/nitrite transporter NarK